MMSGRQERAIEVRKAIMELLDHLRSVPGNVIKAAEARSFIASRVGPENRRDAAWSALLLLGKVNHVGDGNYRLSESGKRELAILKQEFKK